MSLLDSILVIQGLDDQCHLLAVSLLVVLRELMSLVRRRVLCFLSVIYFLLVVLSAYQDRSIDLQRSALDCSLEMVDSEVLSLEVSHCDHHLVALECVVLLEVEVVLEVILCLLDCS